MDFRKTYAGPGRHEGRAGNDPFSQLRDTRQERDDRARFESGGGSGKGVNRPTQSSLAKGNGDNRVLRNSFSARTSGRYNPFSQSVDLGPALRSSSQGGSSIPRQPGLPSTGQAGSAAAPPQPGPTATAAAARAAHEKLQDLIDAGQQREAMLQEHKRHLEATLHSTNLRCAELTRSLQQATAALEAERAAADRLRSERDEHAAELDLVRSQAAELQASGSIALTTSEVCRAALSTAFKGTVSAIGSAHQELETALASQRRQEEELDGCKRRIVELEEQLAAYERDLEEARSARRRISEEMEELAGRLQCREDELTALIQLLVPSEPDGSRASYEAATTRARDLKDRVQQLEQQLESQGVDLSQLRGRVAEYQAQMGRLEERLRGSASGQNSPDGSCKPGDLEAQVSELADEREQLEGDNLQLAAQNEQLRRDNAGLRERLEEALVAAAIVTASSDRDTAAGSEMARLRQELSKATAQAEEYRKQADAEQARADEAQKRAEQAAEAMAAAEAARAELALARVEEAWAEARALQEQMEAVQSELEGAREEVERSSNELAAARDSAQRELHAVRDAADTWRAQAEAAERVKAEEGERARVLAGKIQELSVETAQLRLKVSELQDQLAGTQEARDQLAAMHANENALMQRILAAEVERQQLLQQIDTGNSVTASLRKRLDDAASQVTELADLRSRIAGLIVEADQSARAAAAAAARVAPLEAELQELRDALRVATERASHEARMHERREQQLTVLRQQTMEAEAQQLQAEKEISLLRAQVAVNDNLRACIDELQARLARATLPRPSADAYAQVCSHGGATPDTMPPTHGPHGPHAAHYLNPADEASILAAQHIARQSMVAGWLGAGGSAGGAGPVGPVGSGGGATTVNGVAVQAQPPPTYGGQDRTYGGSLLDSYNAIPEDDDAEDYAPSRARGQGRRGSRGGAPSRRRVRPLRFIVGLMIKGTLVAGGMAVGLALGSPQGLEALRAMGARAVAGGGGGGAGGGGSQRSEQAGEQGVVMVEGMALPAQ